MILILRDPNFSLEHGPKISGTALDEGTKTRSRNMESPGIDRTNTRKSI